MPAFDPVRDAVLNSPVEQTKSPFFAGRRPRSPASQSPSLTRRATDLSVLLNDAAPPPQRAHSSTLSHILRDPADDDKLATSPPLRRSAQQHQLALPGSTFAYPPEPQNRDRSPSPGRLFPDSPRSRPSSSSSFAPAPPSTARNTVSPAHAPSTLPYNPTKRITPADSMLIPLSQTEMQMYRNYCGKGSSKLLRKRKRSTSDEPEQQPAKRHAGDVGLVVDHYNSRPDVGVVQRGESPIIGLKNFNNWVKSVLITRFAHPALASSTYGQGRSKGKVLDMGCGKGGDLTKWAKARIKELLAVDIASVSVDQARDRWNTLKGHRFDATFAALDCYVDSISKAFPPAKLAQPFDVVSMQFCMHYAFETIHKARCMLDNVSRYLRPGGVFVGTIPNSDLLLNQLRSRKGKDPVFGNDVYTIRFEERDHKGLFGHKYIFFLRDAVENVPEYVVVWDNFVQMAREYKLDLLYRKSFHDVFAENQEHPELKPLLVRMKVVDKDGERTMDDAQWEATNIYIAFAFQKRP